MPGHVRDRGKRADGSTKWQARWRHPYDQAVRVEKHFRNRDVAKRWLKRRDAEAHLGMYSDPRPAERRFAELVDAWRETRAPGLAPKTRARYEQIIRTHLLPAFGSGKIADLSRERVKRYFARLEAGGMSPGTVRKVHGVLSALMTEGIDLEMLQVNPCTGALRGQAKVEERERLFLTREEVAALAEAIDPRYRTMIYTAAYTGLRASELYGLRRRDLDLARGVLHVRQALKVVDGSDREPGDATFGTLKSRRSRRVVPLPRFLRAMLGEHLATRLSGGDALVFTGATGAPMRHNLFVRRYFRPAVEASLPLDKRGLRFHDLRHTYAALLISTGAHMKVISEHMGHSSIKVTADVYGHLYESAHEATADALDRTFLASATQENVLSFPVRNRP